MKNNLSAESSISINVPVEQVWQALINPSIIKEYLFGTKAESDWKEGSRITYSGEWQGKEYKDKGQILKLVPNKLLHTTYLSSNSGKEDSPENYANVKYELRPHDHGTKITIKQDNIESNEQLEHMKQNWGTVLASMKKVLEK